MDPNFYNSLFSTPLESFYPAMKGGATIAAASTIYYFLFGGILGMSGLTGSVVKFPTSQATKLKIIVLMGMIFASAGVLYLYDYQKDFQKFMLLPFDANAGTGGSSLVQLIVAGLLVGIGTDLSNGCTSGHGLCGMPRFSVRSFTAVVIFLSTALATATLSLKSHLPQIPQLNIATLDNISIPPQYFIIGTIVVALLMITQDRSQSVISKVLLFLIGGLFGFGLMVAGMTQRSKIYGFLELDSTWDPSLLFVLMTGVMINAITFNFIISNVTKPTYGTNIQNAHGKVDGKLIVGALLFGLGWGIGGLCPGPFILSIPYSLKLAFYWGIPFFLGQKISHSIYGAGAEAKRKIKPL